MTNIGFIGCGKMASAIIRGIIGSGFIDNGQLLASKSNPNNLEELSEKLGIRITLNNREVAEFADILFLAVKPNQLTGVVAEIKDLITPEKVIVSVAAGVKTAVIEALLSDGVKVVRVMPNTPSLVNEGMAGIAGGKFCNEHDLKIVVDIFNSLGKSIVVDESNIDIVTAISGSGPAFYYKVINDIARAGERMGLDYEKALLLSIQTALGSAKMALNRTISMEELINNVATKGGCTRVGIDVMEEKKTEELFFEIINETAKKASALG